LLAAVIFAATVSGAPEFAAAMGSNNPTPPQSSKPSGSTTKQKTKKDKSTSFAVDQTRRLSKPQECIRLTLNFLARYGLV